MNSKHLNLVPPLIAKGQVDEFVNAGQTLSASQSPLDTSLCVFVDSATPDIFAGQRVGQDQPIYFASQGTAPSSERRLFVTDTLIIFSAFQNLAKASAATQSGWLQSGEDLVAIRKLAIDYVNFIKECWVHTSQSIPRAEPLQFGSGHYKSLYTCFSLFVVLYLPEPGYEDVPVGDELMEWLNIHFIEPSTEEGDHLSSLGNPWEDETFWPYLTRTILRGLSQAAVFFLDSLSRHPSEYIHALAKELIPIVSSQPFLQHFTAERDFAHASHRWKERVKGLRIEMDLVPEDERSDSYDNWWGRLSDIVGILEGRETVLLRVCEELGADWKEVCSAWGIFVDTRLRRQDLSDIMTQVIETLPPDPTSLEDMVHSSLLSNKLEKALQYASQLDPWLAAHMADIMQHISLIESSPDDYGEISIRDYYTLLYAESLHADATLWRLTVDYMYSCGDIGQRRADEVLMRVPLKLRSSKPGSSTSGTANEVQTGDVVGVLKEINETCLEHKREEVRRVVCKVAARSLADEKQFGLAISYYTSAEDWVGIGYVANLVLQEFWTAGPLAFTKLAEDVASSIQRMAESGAPHVFVYRLIFAVRYAHFQQLRMKRAFHEAISDLVGIFHEDIAPKSWWAVLLNDFLMIVQEDSSASPSMSGALTLLRKLEEVSIRTQQGSADDYLNILSKSLGRDAKAAHERLQCVRLALAKCLARSYMRDSGGEGGNKASGSFLIR